MTDDSTRRNYEQKRRWQGIHKTICTAFNGLCGNEGAFFRSRTEGAWIVTGGPFPTAPVYYDETIDWSKVQSFTARGRDLLPKLGTGSACTILTVVPAAKTSMGTAMAAALALGSHLVAPELQRLATFDGVHLDPQSAERWSTAFFQQAGPQIQHCLAREACTRVAATRTR